MNDFQPTIIMSKPGIQRDGTDFDAEAFTDGLWARWQMGRARKMGGYRAINNQISGLVRCMHAFQKDTYTYTHFGEGSKLEALTITPDGNTSTLYDRTPAGFAASSDNIWMFDTYRDTIANKTYLVGHAAPNASDISSATATKVWYGELTDLATALVDTTATTVSGGLVSLYPYMVAFGSDGYVQWNVPGNIVDWAGAGSGEAYVTQQKIVEALPLRSSGGPAALLWSLDSLVRMSFVGGSTVWQFDTITAQSSILSQQSVIEYDGVYYWAGVDRFLMFNGVVSEIPNTYNSNWFFENLNYSARQKVFVTKVPRFGEIWWCYPRGTATECTHAIVYNVRERCWYDTPLPNNGRCAAMYPVVFQNPLMVGVEQNSLSRYTLWQHEYGTDEITSTTSSAIRSYVDTSYFALPAQPQNAVNKDLRISIIEPDIVQSGDMVISILGKQNARADSVTTSYNLPATPTTSIDQVIDAKDVRRLLSIRFESNAAGGDYFLGKSIMHIKPETGRVVD